MMQICKIQDLEAFDLRVSDRLPNHCTLARPVTTVLKRTKNQAQKEDWKGTKKPKEQHQEGSCAQFLYSRNVRSHHTVSRRSKVVV